MMCNCCRNKLPPNKVLPEEDSYVQTNQYGRVNGWSCPLHPVQLIGWFFIVLFAVTHFAILVHYLPLAWKGTGVIIPICGYVIHLVYHFFALTLDPADDAVRKKGTFLRKIFDRTKQTHVIENSFCYICQAQVSSRSKHCSKCNKCVADFDHHCVWLNNCIGGRNYKLFLGSCMSAFLTALVMFIIDFYLMIVYYTARSDVFSRSSMNDWELFVPVCKEAYIIFVIVNGLLLFITMLLLGHLLVFHSYLCCKKLSTYDYVVQQRNSQISKDGMNSDIESFGEVAPPPIRPLSSSHSIGYTQDVKQTKGTIEMERMEANAYYADVLQNNSTDDATATVPINRLEITGIGTPTRMEGPVVEENIVSNTITNVYEAPPDEKSTSATSNGRLKHRSSSKTRLIKNDDGEGSLSSAYSLNSVRSADTKIEHYGKMENVLEDFASPRNEVEGEARPVHLQEETAYADIQVERSESVTVDRPHSPSLKHSQRISFVNQQSDYVMRVNEKHSSNSSLSTLALQDHEDRTKGASPANLSRASKPNLSPTREESMESKRSSTSKSSILSSRRIDAASVNGDEVPMLLEESQIASSALSLSNRPLVQIQNQEKAPRHSEVSDISLSEALHSKTSSPKQEQAYDANPRHSVVSTSSNLTLVSERFPIVPSETELTNAAPDEKPGETHAYGVVLTKALSDDGDTLVFEDQFITANDENIDFLHQSLAEEERRKPTQKSANQPPMEVLAEPGVLSDADSQKLATYVDAFKRKKRDSDQFSFGSDTGGSDSDVPLAVLNEEQDAFALKDSLQRVKKLSDAFPSATEQDKQQNRDALPHPRFRPHQSISELSVVEFNRKKKLKKKRPGSSGTTAIKQKQLPPLRGRKPLPEVMEEKDRSESDV